jgi:hypothetical protein
MVMVQLKLSKSDSCSKIFISTLKVIQETPWDPIRTATLYMRCDEASSWGM